MNQLPKRKVPPKLGKVTPDVTTKDKENHPEKEIFVNVTEDRRKELICSGERDDTKLL